MLRAANPRQHDRVTSLRELQEWMRDPAHWNPRITPHFRSNWTHRSEPTLCRDAQRPHILPSYSIPVLRVLIGLGARGQSRQLEMESLFCELHSSSPPASQSPDRNMTSMTPYSEFRTDSYQTACSNNCSVSYNNCYSILSPAHARNLGVVEEKFWRSGSRLVGGALIYPRQMSIHHNSRPITHPAVPARGPQVLPLVIHT